MRAVASKDEARDLVPQSFWSAHPDSRVSLDDAHEMLDRGVECMQDERLGLKLGGTLRFGTGGPFDYAMRSAATISESVAVAARFSRLISDSFHVSLETWRTQSVVRLDNENGWPRGAADFAMSSFFRIHLAEELPAQSKLECWFPYVAPRDTAEYAEWFPGAELKFGAPFLGFAFDRAYATAPMPAADPILHSIHCDRSESLLSELSPARTVTLALRRVIEQEVRCGDASVRRVARALRMSRRTLSRRLELEGTSFTAELDAVRRKTALQYARELSVPLIEVAFLSGFSHVESFYRAFRRWTGQTPLEYRNAAAAIGQGICAGRRVIGSDELSRA